MTPTAAVFVVDDDLSVRRSLHRLLTSADYNVQVFSSAEEVLAITNWPEPCCLIVDVSMPGMTGLDLVDALRALGATLDSTDDGYLPTTVKGTRALRGPARVSGTISSQYLTSLLIIAPLIEGGLTIEVDGELTSKPYLDLTLDEMAKFGVAAAVFLLVCARLLMRGS
jgi:CheY-like chemotaxis protein